jgi:hypothetical protein
MKNSALMMRKGMPIMKLSLSYLLLCIGLPLGDGAPRVEEAGFGMGGEVVLSLDFPEIA